MSLEESSKGSLRFDEFPTSMKRRESFSGPRATRLLASKRKTVRVSSPAPKKPARKDSAVCVSLSSNHNVKEPVGNSGCHLPNPQWKQIPHWESTDRHGVTGDELRSAPQLSEGRAVAYNPAGCRKQPARRGHLSREALIVKGPVTLARPRRFSKRL